ncbi:MAG: hypothetical protein EA346_07960 [Thioalkalivibrio sp.]|nr:MAG: hypothetical protein EA346_07960 [Thioalkalivibrio sp.]
MRIERWGDGSREETRQFPLSAVNAFAAFVGSRRCAWMAPSSKQWGVASSIVMAFLSPQLWAHSEVTG